MKGTRLAPLRILPKSLQFEVAPGDIYEREYADDYDAAELDSNDGMDIDPPKQDLNEQQQVQQTKVSLTPPPLVKAEVAGSAATGVEQQTDNAAFMEMFKQQTLLIQSLQATIAGLQEELSMMRKEAAAKAASQEVDDSNL